MAGRSRDDPLRPSAGDLLEAVGEIANSAGVTEGELTAVVGQAILDTYRRLVVDDPGLRFRVDLRKGVQEIFRLEPEGGETLMPALTGDAARQAAQAVRSAVLECLRYAGAERVLTEATLRRGELIDCIVESRAGNSWYLRAGDLTVVLPPEEQAAGETPVPRQLIKVVILEGRRRAKDAVVVGSRSHPQLVRLLLEQEVPELVSGKVVIRAIAREAGRARRWRWNRAIRISMRRVPASAPGGCATAPSPPSSAWSRSRSSATTPIPPATSPPPSSPPPSFP